MGEAGKHGRGARRRVGWQSSHAVGRPILRHVSGQIGGFGDVASSGASAGGYAQREAIVAVTPALTSHGERGGERRGAERAFNRSASRRRSDRTLSFYGSGGRGSNPQSVKILNEQTTREFSDFKSDGSVRKK
ncbi:hypothetical protein NL676_022126 [Syzygium grande]|nr:hypothetical protein NL676_022126 [Syzygium grande]